jgi:hypothetical protein
MNNLNNSNTVFVEVKCPCCSRHLDKFKVSGTVLISRKCKSCKNNIVTEIQDDKILFNKIDAIENSKDIISPNRFIQKK